LLIGSAKVLYERYSWAVHRFTEPILALGNDPVVLVKDQEKRVGSFSQIALGENALSIYRSLPEMVAEAVEVVASSNRIMVPIGPTHALVLTHLEQLWPPGRYDQPVKLAENFNLLTMVSSREWIAWNPEAEARIATKNIPTARLAVPMR
jgi:hypothetical protein